MGGLIIIVFINKLPMNRETYERQTRIGWVNAQPILVYICLFVIT